MTFDQNKFESENQRNKCYYYHNFLNAKQINTNFHSGFNKLVAFIIKKAPRSSRIHHRDVLFYKPGSSLLATWQLRIMSNLYTLIFSAILCFLVIDYILGDFEKNTSHAKQL